MFNFFKKLSSKTSKNRTFNVSEYLDTEGLKNILLPVLEKHYPQNVLEVLKSDDFVLGGTPYFAYLFLLQKYDYLNCNTEFKGMSFQKKLEHLIIDRGAGNDTAFSTQEKESMLKASLNNHNDVILTIINCEQSTTEGSYGYPWNLKDFLGIALEIEKAYLEYRKIDSLE